MRRMLPCHDAIMSVLTEYTRFTTQICDEKLDTQVAREWTGNISRDLFLSSK